MKAYSSAVSCSAEACCSVRWLRSWLPWAICALAVAKVGLGGAGASVGLAKALGSFGAGTAVTGGIIRTFGEPLNATARRTYVGGAVHLWPLLALGGEVGYYVRLGDEPGASVHGKRMITWSAGFGF